MIDWEALERIPEEKKLRAEYWLEEELGVTTTNKLNLIEVNDAFLWEAVLRYANVLITDPGSRVATKLKIDPVTGIFHLIVRYTKLSIAIHGNLWDQKVTDVRVYT